MDARADTSCCWKQRPHCWLIQFRTYHVISGYTELILPLIEKYPCLLDSTGVGGTTCRQLLSQLVRRRKGPKDEVIHPYVTI